MKSQIKLTLTAGFCLLGFRSLLPASAQQISSVDQVQSDISPQIQGVERDTIAGCLESLPPDARDNVILYAQDGNIYVNKPELRAQELPLVQVEDNVYQDTTGNLFSFPEYTTRPDETTVYGNSSRILGQRRPNVWDGKVYKTSGPYRQVYSKIPPDDYTPGYSYEDAQIYLPSGVPKKIGRDTMRQGLHYKYTPKEVYENPKTQDTAYVYMGGWSAKAKFIPLGSTGAWQTYFALDAGFQHDKKPHGIYSSDSWLMVIGAEHYGSKNRASERAGAFRLIAGQKAFLTKFFVSTSSGRTYLNLVAVNASAIDAVTGNSIGSGTWTVSQEVTQPMDDQGNSTGTVVDATGQNFCPWNINGNGIVLKRMTSIAQQIKNPTGPGNVLKSDPTTCSYIKNVQWTNCHIGFYGASGQPTSVALWDDTSYGGAIDFAFDPALPNVVFHVSGSGYDETDYIKIP